MTLQHGLVVEDDTQLLTYQLESI